MKNDEILVYVLIEESTYNGDDACKVTLFIDKDEALVRYEESKEELLKACDNDGEPPTDITDATPDFDTYEGFYVYEKHENDTPDGVFNDLLIYLMGEYADDHAYIRLKTEKLNLKKVRSNHLTINKIHSKI